VRRAPSPSDFFADPIGRWVGARVGVLWWPSRDLFGLTMWGTINDDDLDLVQTALSVLDHPSFRHMRLCTDTAALENMSPRTFAVVQRRVQEHTPTRRQIERQALVHGTNMIGAAMAGFFRATPVPYDTRTFHSLGPALAWLGAPEVEAEIGAAVDEARGTSAMLMRLRAALAAQPRRALREVAAEIGASSRSLQRQLEAAGTTFRREARVAAVHLAQDMLLGEQTIASIACACGFKSSPQLAAAFRALHGCSPSQWRAQQRAGDTRPDPVARS
jgi:AraC-like DNA-binding protein